MAADRGAGQAGLPEEFPDRLLDRTTALAALTRRGGGPADRLAALLLGAAAAGLLRRRGGALWRLLRARPLAGALLAAAAAQWLWQVGRLQLWGALRGPWPAPLLGTAWRVLARGVPTLHQQNLQDRCLFGDIFAGTYWGTQLAVAACPHFFRRVFITHWKEYDRSRLEKECFSELLGQGLILVDNAEWGEMRRLYQPAFSDGNMLAFGGLVKQWTTEFADTLLAQSRSERAIDIQSAMVQFAFRLIGMFALGVDFEDRARYAAEYAQMTSADIGCSNFGELWGMLLERTQDRLPFGRLQWWKLVKTRGVRSFERAHKLLLDLVDRIIEERSNGHNQVDKPVEFQDLLSLILCEKGRRYSRTEARHQVLTFLFAGHDTTTSLVSWCLWLLAARPEHLARAQAEADAHASGGGGRPFLRSCLLETLRLYPSVPARGRSLEATGDEFAVPAPERCPMLQRRGGRLPLARGTAVVLAVNAVHRHPGYWERPDAFEPSRFEDHLRSSAASPLFSAPRPSEKDDALTYLPFGAGPRRCIGERLALLEAEEICGGLLRRCGLRLPPGAARPATELALTLRARGGIRLLLDERGAG